MKKILILSVLSLFLSVSAYAGQPPAPVQSVAGLVGSPTAAQVATSLAGQAFTNLALSGGSLTTTDISQALINTTGGTNTLSPAVLSNNDFDVRFKGAKCDGTTNDYTAIQAALNYVATLGGLTSGRVTLPPGRVCRVSPGVIVPQRVVFTGVGRNTSQLAAFTDNMPYIVQLNTFSILQSMEVNAIAADGNTVTSGVAVDDGSLQPSNSIVRDVFINNPCIGMDLSGNSDRLEDSYIAGSKGTGCGGLRVGHYTTNTATTDPRISGNTINSDPTTPADYDMKIEDAGGLLMTDNDFLQAKIGIWIQPSTNQALEWDTFGQSYYGDTNSSHSMLIDTADASAIISGLTFNGGWDASSSATGVVIQNTANATVSGFHFIGTRFFNNNGNVLEIHAGVSNVSVQDSFFCGNVNTASAIYVEAGVSDVTIQNNNMQAQCDHFPSNSLVGINLVGGNARMMITGNHMNGLNTPMNGVPTTDSIVNDNIPLNTESNPLTIAATLNLGNSFSAYGLSGAAVTVTNMTGGWQGRHVILYGPSAYTFTNGGTAGSAICNSTFTSVANQPIDAYFYGCWLLK